MAAGFTLTDATFRSSRHATRYWETGPADGPLMVFLHGWPEIGLVWRAQIVLRAAEGQPLRRIAEAVDQAKVICFLASSDADFVTGVTIDVTGGN